jgi:hypothetical protein
MDLIICLTIILMQHTVIIKLLLPFKNKCKPGKVMHTYKQPSIWEAEAGGLQVSGQQDPVSNAKSIILKITTLYLVHIVCLDDTLRISLKQWPSVVQ